jgi:uncharacterized membrane protein YeaQ/YmgE (transglycosylase-associated protein family)
MDVNIFLVILVGIVIGFVARFLMPGRDPIGFVMTVVIGVAGALIGTYLWDEVLFKKNSDNEGVALFGGLIVAMLLLWIYRQVTYGRHRVG